MDFGWHDNVVGYEDRTRQELLSNMLSRLPGQKPTLSERKIMMLGPLLDIYAGDTLLFRKQPKAILLHYCQSLSAYLSSSSSPGSPESIRFPEKSTDGPSLCLVLEYLRAIALTIREEPPPLVPPSSLVPAIRLTETAKLFDLREARALDTRIFRRLRYAQLTAANIVEMWDTLPHNSIWITRMVAWLHAHRQKGDVTDWVRINRLMVKKPDLALFLVKHGRVGLHELSDSLFWTEEEWNKWRDKEERIARSQELRARTKEKEEAEKRFQERKANPHLLRRLSERKRSIMEEVARTHAELMKMRRKIARRRWRGLLRAVRVVVILAKRIQFEWADDEFY